MEKKNFQPNSKACPTVYGGGGGFSVPEQAAGEDCSGFGCLWASWRQTSPRGRGCRRSLTISSLP